VLDTLRFLDRLYYFIGSIKEVAPHSDKRQRSAWVFRAFRTDPTHV